VHAWSHRNGMCFASLASFTELENRCPGASLAASRYPGLRSNLHKRWKPPIVTMLECGRVEVYGRNLVEAGRN
jgi:hypothetical protein